MKIIFKIGGLFAGMLIMSLAIGSAQAAILLSENWEGSVAEVRARWPGSAPGLTTDPSAFVSLSTLRPFGGAQSLRMHYIGTQYDTPPHSGGNVSRSFPPASDVWVTWTEYWAPGFITAGGNTVCNPPAQICGAGTKNWYLRGSDARASGSQVPTYFWGDRKLAVGCQGCYDVPSDKANPNSHYGSSNMYQNQGVDFSIPDGHHVCYEYHIKLNTPGVADGQIELYVQDLTAGTPNRRVTNYTGRQMRAPVSDGPNATFPYNAQYSGIQAYRQDGYGDIYKDNLTISTTRHGCSGTPPPPPPPDAQAPSIPGSLTASAVSSSQINLTWTASTDNVGMSGYKIFRSGTQIATTAGTSYSNTGLSASTAYSYTVAAYDAAGNTSGQSAAKSATTLAAPTTDATAPTVPAGLSAQAISASQINLTWTAAADNVGVAGYRIFRGGTQIGTWAGASYSNTGLTASTAYSYTVAAYDTAGNVSAQSAAASATTQASTPPVGAVGTVSNLSAAAIGANGATLSFTEVNDGTGQPAKYDIRYSSSGALWGAAPSVTQGTCASPLAGTAVGAVKTCTVLGLSPAKAYQFQLVPFRGTLGAGAVFGSLSNVAGATTSAGADAMPPAKPGNLRML